MHTRSLLLLASLGMCPAAAMHAQTTAPAPTPATTAPAPGVTAPLPDAPPGSVPLDKAVPIATPESLQNIQRYPGYDQHDTPTTTAPVPVTAPPPVLVPRTGNPYAAWPPYHQPAYYQSYLPETRRPGDSTDNASSAYIPVDNWIYPQMTRLYSLGYVPTMFLTLRPWTRLSVVHMLEESQAAILDGDSEEAKEILAVVLRELSSEHPDTNRRPLVYGAETVYVRALGIGGQPLRDSYHLGQTIINDYGRPYQNGFNAQLGGSVLAEWRRFSFYARGEYQHAPAAAGYSQALSSYLSGVDGIPYSGYNLNQATIPTGPIGAQNPFRILEATLSFHVLGHEISGGKSDAWLGPGQGASMAWSNNAEDIYSFRINRVEPLRIPLLSYLLGPIRYDFFYGSLKGHTYPNSPWTHSEAISFHPSQNFELSFQRTIIFGGQGHEPVTLHTFLKGFFSTSDTTGDEKYSRNDPGARFTSVSFDYRLPFVRKYLTLYGDSTTHDDVFPISAPRRAGWRSGLFLSQVPRLNKIDLRVEGVYTDFPTLASINGQGTYIETIQRSGYTNKGFLMGDWVGREGKGGQAWLTYHLSGNESVQLEYRTKKTAKDFIVGGTTQNLVKLSVTKRLGHEVELNGWYQFERWKAPVYKPGQQSDHVGAFQVTYFPGMHER